jgi:adenylate kinase family enzyme
MWDGTVYSSRECFSFSDIPDNPQNGVLVRMLYYSDGTRQVQQGVEFFYESEHPSGEPVRGTAEFESDIRTRYRNPIIRQGQWAPDEFYDRIVKEAMETCWNGD